MRFYENNNNRLQTSINRLRLKTTYYFFENSANFYDVNQKRRVWFYLNTHILN